MLCRYCFTLLDAGVLEAIKGSDRFNSAMDSTRERDSKNFTWSDTCWNTLLLMAAIIMWGFTTSMYPDFDGVSVYDLRPGLPKPQLSISTKKDSTNSDDTFIAGVKLMDYCIIPNVFDELTKPANSATSTYLISRGFNSDEIDATGLANVWTKYDKGVMKRTELAEYNLPTGLSNEKSPLFNSQYYPPVCRCISNVFRVYNAKNQRADDTAVKKATEAINNCIATEYIVKRQTLLGNDDSKNNDMKSRKYISRHATLFQLCFAFLISFLYNRLDFTKMNFGNPAEWNGENSYYFAALFLSFVILFCLNFLSIPSVLVGNGVNFSSIIILPGGLIALIIELMWSFAAKRIDIGRQTFIHPATFYLVISALYIIASIENGVFTLSVLVTQIFQACILTMAYACTLFVMHGGIWKNSTSSRTGFFIVILLSGLVCIRHLTPLFPVNTSASIFLWLLPTIFGVICYAKVLFVDHLFGEDITSDKKRYRITHSTHLFDIIYCMLISVVVLYFMLDILNLDMGNPNSTASKYNTAGKLTKKLNFALAEIGVSDPLDKPFYEIVNKDNKNIFINKELTP